MFISERGAPFSTEGFARMLQRAAQAAGLTIRVHPHMLRHACGFKLANDGHDTRAMQAYSATRTSSTRSATPSWRRAGSKISGGTNDETPTCLLDGGAARVLSDFHM